MKIINYFDAPNKQHWLDAIARSDWRAGAFLCKMLSNGTLFDNLGDGTRVLLLTDGDELISYCTYSRVDDIQPTDLTPWVGFVYTFPEYRDRRMIGLLFDEVEQIAAGEGVSKVYLSTNHVGLYEKYGFEFLTMMNDVDGNPSRIYVKNIGGTIMNNYIAYCGLDCEKCEARLATMNNDDDLRTQVAKKWSEMNNVEITPEMINCAGCRMDGVKFAWCESMCPIRQCAMGKCCATCGDCGELESCEKVGMIIGNNPDALANLKGR